jgi:hypothetical protein
MFNIFTDAPWLPIKIEFDIHEFTTDQALYLGKD